MTRYRAEQLIIQQILTNNAGRLIRELREAYGLNQYQVAAECNFNQSRVSAIETSKFQPNMGSLVEVLMGIGAARVRREICNDECPCKRIAENHTAEEIPDSTRHLPGQAEIGQEVLRPGDGDLERVHDA